MLDTIQSINPLLITSLFGCLALASFVALRHKPLTSRRPGFRGRVNAETVDARAALVTQIQADGLSKLERVRARAARLREAVAAALRSLRREEAKLETLQAEHDRVVGQAADDPKPVVSVKTAKRAKVLAVLGDNFVVAAAIMENETSVSPLLAAAIALAISIALVMLGWLAGIELRDRVGQSGAWIGGLSTIALVILSIALFALRLDATVAWVALAIAPAIATATLAMIGPSTVQQEVVRLDKATGRQAKAVAKAEKKMSRLQGRLDALRSMIETRVQVIALTALAEGRRTGVQDPIDDWRTAGSRTGISEVTLGQGIADEPVAEEPAAPPVLEPNDPDAQEADANAGDNDVVDLASNDADGPDEEFAIRALEEV